MIKCLNPLQLVRQKSLSRPINFCCFLSSLLICSFVASFFLYVNSATAGMSHGRECTLAFLKAEKKHNIPSYLLEAISIVESSCYRKKNGKVDIHPWTVCVNGRDYFCSSKSAAVEKVKFFRSRKIKNIDVGLMQINIRHHGHRFLSTADMFDPAKNVDYAAGFLKNLYRKTGSWPDAVALYHSGNKRHSVPYKNRVFATLYRIRNNAWKSNNAGMMILSSIQGSKKKPAHRPPRLTSTDLVFHKADFNQ